MNKSTRRRKPPAFLAMIIISVLVIVAAGITVKNLARRVLVDVVLVRESSLEKTADADFTVLRQETVLTAPYSGTLELLFEEGERVPKDAAVGFLLKETGTSLERVEKIPLRAARAGVLSYYTDGQEGLYAPENWTIIESAAGRAAQGLLPHTTGNPKEGIRVAAGDSICKITDNLTSAYLCADNPGILSAHWSRGKTVELRLEGFQETIQAELADIIEKDDTNRVLFRISSLPGLERYRFLRGKLVKDRQNGVVLDEKHLVEKNGIVGAYLMENGRVVWREIKVALRLESQVLLEGLSPGEWVIAAPHLVKEGQRVFPLRP